MRGFFHSHFFVDVIKHIPSFHTHFVARSGCSHPCVTLEWAAGGRTDGDRHHSSHQDMEPISFTLWGGRSLCNTDTVALANFGIQTLEKTSLLSLGCLHKKVVGRFIYLTSSGIVSLTVMFLTLELQSASTYLVLQLLKTKAAEGHTGSKRKTFGAL